MKPGDSRAPGRRAVLAGASSLILSGCAGGPGRSDGTTGTAVIGLRIANTLELGAARDRHFGGLANLFHRADPWASLSFGQVDPATGGVDMPWFATLKNVKAEVTTKGFATSFEAVSLVPGRYVTLNAHFIPDPSAYYRTDYVLEFSSRYGSRARAEDLVGYQFDIAAGELVYVGTIVLALGGKGGGESSIRYGHAVPRLVDEFTMAAARHPALHALGRERGTRLMTLFSNRLPHLFRQQPPAPTPAAPAPAAPAPAAPAPAAPAPAAPVPAAPPARPRNVPRIG
ncbi:hypothetical protein GCM10017083_15060 [Thalassobaculum fulvum]|uniref:Lipoprotein n=1 Tax=Thalassobaculum fulvum TaxID=1633335 RepID=A0A918XQH2_9PROT|nr:hypothetical protein [Thalassobaculum fulvum]GHD46195.1 hypothetical protein GCM10017083_15060 [Thalassobaculum fulvum]